MTAKNEYLPFATGKNADVLSPDAYSDIPARTRGCTTGIEKTDIVNTAWRQSSVVSATVAQFIADHSGEDVLDDGDIVKLQASLEKAISEFLPTASLTQKGVTQLSSATNSTDETMAATPKAVKAAYDLAASVSDSVSSVNGKKGDVVLSAQDVGAYPITGGNVAGYVDALYLRAYSGDNPASQGTFIGWNESGGLGESNLTNNRGGGPGGFKLRTVNSNNTIETGSVSISGTGDLTTTGDISSPAVIRAQSDLRSERNISCAGLIQAGAGVYDTPGVRVYSPNNPPPQQYVGVTDVQIVGRTGFVCSSGTYRFPAGCVLTGLGDFGADNGYGEYSAIQKMINGTWYTIGGN
jgi:hypothetical protein